MRVTVGRQEETGVVLVQRGSALSGLMVQAGVAMTGPGWARLDAMADTGMSHQGAIQ